jgi:Flp pilus assembly protein TadD
LLRRGYIELALGRPALAQTRFREAARRAPDMPETHLALALSADQAGDRKGAERELRVAHRLRPTDWRILILLAQNLNGQRRYDQALGVLEEAGRIAPAEPAVYATKAAVLYDQAHGQENRGTAAARFEPALTAARRWLALDPNSRDAHNLLANIFLESGDEAEAQRLWERIYAVDPAYPKLRLNLGRLLVRRGDRTRGLRLLADERRIRDEAAEFNRLVILAGAQNENPAAHRQLARWCQKQGRLSRAILEWREVLARLPADAEAQAGLRRCLTLRGDPL